MGLRSKFGRRSRRPVQLVDLAYRTQGGLYRSAKAPNRQGASFLVPTNTQGVRVPNEGAANVLDPFGQPRPVNRRGLFRRSFLNSIR